MKKKVKEGITWDPNGSNGYVQNIIEKGNNVNVQ